MRELHRFISLTETFAKCWQPEINAAQSRRLLETEYWMSHTAALPTESHLSQRLKEAQIRGQKTEVACDYRKRRLTMKAFLPTVRRLSHCNVNTQSQQPSRRVGIAAPQSLVQNEVSTQSTARRVWDRAETDKKSMCVYFGKSASSCLWGKDREKTAWLQFPGQDRKTAAWGRREDREREGEVWGLVWSTLNVFPEQFERTPPPQVEERMAERNVGVHIHTVILHLLITSSFPLNSALLPSFCLDILLKYCTRV